MLEREVVRTRHDDGQGAAEWTADCALTFRNLTREEFDVEMRQPDWELVGQDYVDWILAEFEASVDGSHVPAERSRTHADGGSGPAVQDYLNCAWNWSVHFRPRATVQVRTRYAFQSVGGVGPIDACVAERAELAANPPFWTVAPASPSGKAFGCCSCASVSYVGHGGRAWARPIRKVEITIDLPEASAPHRLAFFPPPTRVDRDLAIWRFADWEPDDVRIVIVEKGSELLFELPEQARAWTAYAERSHLSGDMILAVLEGYLHRHAESSATLARRAATGEEDGIDQRAACLLVDPALPANEADIIRELLRAAERAPR